jgi:ribosomal protein S25
MNKILVSLAKKNRESSQNQKGKRHYNWYHKNTKDHKRTVQIITCQWIDNLKKEINSLTQRTYQYRIMQIWSSEQINNE